MCTSCSGSPPNLSISLLIIAATVSSSPSFAISSPFLGFQILPCTSPLLKYSSFVLCLSLCLCPITLPSFHYSLCMILSTCCNLNLVHFTFFILIVHSSNSSIHSLTSTSSSGCNLLLFLVCTCLPTPLLFHSMLTLSPLWSCSGVVVSATPVHPPLLNPLPVSSFPLSVSIFFRLHNFLYRCLFFFFFFFKF